MNKLILLLACAIVSGCAASYAVVEETDKFSDPNQPARYAVRSNYIVRNEIGVARDDSLDPFVNRDRKTGKVVSAGFFLLRTVSEPERAWTGAPKWLAIREGDEIEILADGERVALKAVWSKLSHNSSFANGLNTTMYFDQASYMADPLSFAKIAQAKTIEIKVNGTHGSTVYPRDGAYMLDSFYENLHRFYSEQIAPHL